MQIVLRHYQLFCNFKLVMNLQLIEKLKPLDDKKNTKLPFLLVLESHVHFRNSHMEWGTFNVMKCLRNFLLNMVCTKFVYVVNVVSRNQIQ